MLADWHARCTLQQSDVCQAQLLPKENISAVRRCRFSTMTVLRAMNGLPIGLILNCRVVLVAVGLWLLSPTLPSTPEAQAGE